MGHLQLLLLLMVQLLLKSQQVSTASFLLPVISGRETLKTERLLEIPSSSQADPAPQDNLKGSVERLKATGTSLSQGRSW